MGVDVRTAVNWTFLQSIAWIFMRDLSVVEMAMSFDQQREPRHTYLEENPRTGEGPVETIDPIELTNLTRLGIWASLCRDENSEVRFPFETENEAERELFDKLRAGALEANGATNGTGEFRKIAPFEYSSDMRLVFGNTPGEKLEDNRVSIWPIYLKRADVMSIWPQIPEKMKSIAGQTKCKGWLVEQMRQSETPKKTKEEYKKEALALFDVSVRSFRTAWSAAIEETGRSLWSKPGRKS